MYTIPSRTKAYMAMKASITGEIGACPACPQRRNRNETWGGPSELSGVRQAARCLYDAGEPSWARCRCYSSSRQPIQYTACVGLLHLFQKVTVQKKKKKKLHDFFVKRAVDFVPDLVPFLQLFSGMHFTAEFSHRKSQDV